MKFGSFATALLGVLLMTVPSCSSVVLDAMTEQQADGTTLVRERTVNHFCFFLVRLSYCTKCLSLVVPFNGKEEESVLTSLRGDSLTRRLNGNGKGTKKPSRAIKKTTGKGRPTAAPTPPPTAAPTPPPTPPPTAAPTAAPSPPPTPPPTAPPATYSCIPGPTTGIIEGPITFTVDLRNARGTLSTNLQGITSYSGSTLGGSVSNNFIAIGLQSGGSTPKIATITVTSGTFPSTFALEFCPS